MIAFYDIDIDYVNWLKKYEPKVPNISYSGNNKFLCGTVLEIADIKYFAPISSNTKVFKTSLPIYDETSGVNTILSTIRFSFMIPIIDRVITLKDFTKIRESDPNYANLLTKEWNYCKNHEEAILKKARAVYKYGCNPNHFFHSTCCDFKKLESVYRNYNK